MNGNENNFSVLSRMSNFLRLFVLSLVIVMGPLVMPAESIAAVVVMNWQGWFTMLNRFGDSLMNSSINGKVANQFITPITGTLNYDTDSGIGTITIEPFDFMGNSSDEPFRVHDASFELIDGGLGTLALGNMLYDWNYNRDVSFSIVWDISGMLQGLDNGYTNISSGSVPAADGTYAPYKSGIFLEIGESPIATTSYDTTNVSGCVNLDCIGYNPSGTLPLLTDDELNRNKSDFSTTDIYGIGGSPIMDSGFQYKNLNIDIVNMQVLTVDGVPVISTAGDLNDDTNVDIVDLILLQQIVLGLRVPTPLQINRADNAPLVNGIPRPDGILDAGDIQVLQRKVLNEIDF